MGAEPNGDQIRWAKRAADFYRTKGLNPLPSRHDKKAPALLTYAECYRELLDEGRYRAWSSGNVQVVTGVKWNLAVVDCDGKEGVDHFAAIWEAKNKEEFDSDGWLANGLPWIVLTGGGGVHLWFSLPEDLLWLKSKRLWGVWEPERQDWKKRANVELIGDGKLIVAPPSIHVDTGKRYEWFDKYSPKHSKRPGLIPDWILELPAMEAPRKPNQAQEPVVRQSSPTTGDEYDREDVLRAIPDKVALATSWRLRFASDYPNEAGWVPCHAISRAMPGSRSDDQNPSARFHADLGIYMEMYSDGERPLSLFDLGVALGAYSHWRHCLNDLGSRFNAVKFKDSGR